MFTSRRKAALATTAACLLVLPPMQAAVAAPESPAPPSASTQADERAVYTVPNTDTMDRTRINETGAQVLSEEKGVATVEATEAQAEQMRKAGFAPTKQSDVASALKRASGPAGSPKDFPPDDQGYHNYDEVIDVLDKAVADHGNIAEKSSIGKSFEGRDIPVLKISDNVAKDE